MKQAVRYLAITIFSVFVISCSQVNLNGHYHLEMNGSNHSYQVWNIKDNRMVINKENCLDTENDCFSSQLVFKGNKILIKPWVDVNCEYQYEIEKNGTVKIFDDKTKMKLVPHQNCISNETYFSSKTSRFSNSFHLVEETMTGMFVIPSEYENELIVLTEGMVFNNVEINSIKMIPRANNKSIWLHVDKRVKLKIVMPILKELFEKGYKFSFSALSKTENNEQILLLNRNIEGIKERNKSFKIDICDFCEKYTVDKIQNVLKIEVLGVDRYLFQNDTIDLFQVRNRIVKYLRQNRKTRLHTQIQIKISLETKFENYLKLIDELKFVHVQLSEIIIYNGENDKDTEVIKKNNIDKTKEFPLRILEVIE